MEAVRQSWTDDRLDEFGRRIDERFDHVDGRFDQVDQRFDRVEGDIRELRTEMRGSSEELRAEMRESNEELRASIGSDIASLRDDNRELRGVLQRTMFQMGGGMIVAILGLIVTRL